MINNEENDVEFPRESISNNENIIYDNNGNNTKGFPRYVTAVTAVTNNNTVKGLSYTDNTILPENLCRFYEKSDRWCCNKCNDRGDKWYMLQHNCKMNKK